MTFAFLRNVVALLGRSLGLRAASVGFARDNMTLHTVFFGACVLPVPTVTCYQPILSVCVSVYEPCLPCHYITCAKAPLQ